MPQPPWSRSSAALGIFRSFGGLAEALDEDDSDALELPDAEEDEVDPLAEVELAAEEEFDAPAVLTALVEVSESEVEEQPAAPSNKATPTAMVRTEVSVVLM